MNQFETIFFTHILNEPSARKAYDNDHENIFALENVKFPQEVEKLIS